MNNVTVDFCAHCGALLPVGPPKECENCRCETSDKTDRLAVTASLEDANHLYDLYNFPRVTLP